MKEARAELWYPRSEGPDNVDRVRVSLYDVRAANDLVIQYDFDRDGYSIQQPTIHEWPIDSDSHDEGLVEVAFVAAWASSLPSETGDE